MESSEGGTICMLQETQPIHSHTHTHTLTLSLSPSPLQPENAHLLTFQAPAGPFCSRFRVAAGNYVVRVGSK